MSIKLSNEYSGIDVVRVVHLLHLVNGDTIDSSSYDSSLLVIDRDYSSHVRRMYYDGVLVDRIVYKDIHHVHDGSGDFYDYVEITLPDWS